MRFFKSFTLLHRRTKSDSQLSDVSATPGPKRRSLVLSNVLSNGSFQPDILDSSVYSPSQPATYAVNLRLFDLQVENTRLHHVACLTATELAQVKAQLHTVRSELLVELHRNARRAKADNYEIERLRSALACDNRLLTLTMIPEHHPSSSDSQATLKNIHTLKRSTDLTPGSLASFSRGLSIEDGYLSSLRMTLKSRKDLRESRKVAKFWKRIAQQEGLNSKVVTPSSSNISSIHEPLSTERQSAVNLLIAQRQKENDEQSAPQNVACFLEPLSASTSRRPRTPTLSSSCLPFDLPPLASQSFRQEMASISSRTLLLERSTTLQNIRTRMPSLPSLRKEKPRVPVSRGRYTKASPAALRSSSHAYRSLINPRLSGNPTTKDRLIP
jgi:hypothetical protein